MDRWSRRQVVRRMAGLSLAAVLLTLLASCNIASPPRQRPVKVYRVGILGTSSQPYHETFRQELQALGYVEGQNIVLEPRFAEGHPDRIPSLAAELAGLDLDAMLMSSDYPIRAAKEATTSIPIVMVACDAVAAGLIDSLAHPGGNITGVTCISSVISGKRLELLKMTLGDLSQVAVLWNAADPGKQIEWRDMQGAAQQLGGVRLRSLEVRDVQDFEGAFTDLSPEPLEPLVVLGEGFTITHRARIVGELTARHVPAIYAYREFVEAGGLMSYGPSLPAMFGRAAYYVDRILKGAKPSDLPVEQPREFEFVVKLKAAQALGLTIPQSVLLQATEVIQ